MPLKTMCSMKWLMPVCSGLSWRLPRLSQTPMATLRTWGMALGDEGEAVVEDFLRDGHARKGGERSG